VQQMTTQPLAIDLPIAGSTLQQLRELQRQHGSTP